MALFKIEKGLAANLATNRPNSVEGYCYFTSDDGKFYIDIATGTALTPAENGGSLLGVTRMPINSYLSDWAARAYADETGDILKSSYGAKLKVDGHTLKLIAKDNVAQLSSITLPDEKVKQTAVSALSYTNWRPLVWGASNSATEGFTPSTITDGVFVASTLSVQPSSGTIKANNFKGKLIGNADTASQFYENKKIELTGPITGKVSSKGGWTIATKISNSAVDTANIVDRAVTNAKIANPSITINGKSVSLGGSLTLTDIGLSSALRFIGITSDSIVDGSTKDSVTINNNIVKAEIGNVVINNLNNQEYLWTGLNWELLGDESSYEKIGTAQGLIDLIKFTPDVTSVLGIGTTISSAASAVSFGTHTKKNVVGTGATFTVTNPTITVVPAKTNIKATATGAAVVLNTDAAVTGIEESITSDFVTSYSGSSSKLNTTTIKGVAGTTSASKISSNTSVTATKINSFGTAAILTSTYIESTESLVMSWTPNTIATGTNVTATNTVYSDSTVAVAASNATTVATGSLSSTGQGSSVMTGLGTKHTASAITALGDFIYDNFATSVNSVSNPTIALETGATAGTGVISIVSGISSASATGGAVKFNSTDAVSAITDLGAATAAAQKITINASPIRVLTESTTFTKT